MRKRQWRLLLGAAACAGLMTAPSAMASSIGVKFVGGGGGAGNQADDVRVLPSDSAAGVVPATNWNNVNGFTGTQPALAADNAAATAATVTWAADGQWTAHNTPAGSTGDQILTNGYLDDTAEVPGVPGPPPIPAMDNTDTAITMSGLSATFVGPYDVYVYFGSDGNNRTGSATLGGRTYYGETNTGGTTGFDGTFTRAISTDPLAVTVDSEYFLFEGVSGDSFALTVDRISNNFGIHGVQVVGTLVPEPAGLALAGIAALGVLARRRRRA